MRWDSTSPRLVRTEPCRSCGKLRTYWPSSQPWKTGLCAACLRASRDRAKCPNCGKKLNSRSIKQCADCYRASLPSWGTVCPQCGRRHRSQKSDLCWKCRPAISACAKNRTCVHCGAAIAHPAKQCWDCYNIQRGAKNWRCVDCGTPVGWRITRCMACYRRHAGFQERQLPLVAQPIGRCCRLCGSVELSPTSHHCPRCVARERERIRAVVGGDVATADCAHCGTAFPVRIHELARGNGRFCSRECYFQWRAANQPEAPSKRFYSGRRADLGGRYFRSKWEANWARYLNWLLDQGQIVSWEYESQTFEFTAITRGNRFYLPDFRVVNGDGSVEFHEVKGHMTPASKTKLDRMRRYYPDVVVKVIGRDAYTSIAREIGRRLPGWE